MLDAYIVDRLRRKQEQARQKDARIPLYIDERPPPPRPREDERKDAPERGSTVIDYSA